jgi:hypothetical protein
MMRLTIPIPRRLGRYRSGDVAHQAPAAATASFLIRIRGPIRELCCSARCGAKPQRRRRLAI